MGVYRILNLYACLGGNRYKWDQVAEEKGLNIEVTAVEINPEISEIYKQTFPKDTVITGDAHEYLLNNFEKFDFIWSSPPCPTHSKMMKATRHNVKFYPDLKLYEEILLLQHFFKGKYVVENVASYYEPLINPYKSSRHFYWSNFKIYPCKTLPKIKDLARANREEIGKYLGFNYPGKNIYLNGGHDPAKILRNCIHPNEGAHILGLALGIHKSDNAKQTSLF